MNRLVRSLADRCRDDLLAEKCLIAPSLRVGHQWLESVVRAGQPAVNVRINTIRCLALDLAGPELAAKKFALVTVEGTGLLIDSVLGQLLRDKSGYLSHLQPSAGLSQAMLSAIEALRQAGMDARMLRPEAFEVPAKAQDISNLLRAYLGQLDALGLVDYAALLRMAKSRLQRDRSALAEDVLILIPEDLEITALERELLDALPTKHLLVFGVDQPSTAPDDGENELSDAMLLRWLPSPAEAPAPKQDGTAEIFRAVGEVNEVREVFRRCLEAGRSLDEVEVLHTDTETYVPLFYELAWRLQPETDNADKELPITFAEGLPVRYSRPGRALMAWLAWAADDFPQATLVRMIQDGLLKIPGHDREQFSFSSLAVVLRSVGIGLGRDRYLPQLAEQIAGCERQLADPDEFVGEDGEQDVGKQAALARQLESLRLLETLTCSLLAITPRSGAAPKVILAAAEAFLAQFARAVNEFDHFALNALSDEVQVTQQWLEQVGGELSREFQDWLAGLVNRIRVGGSGPRPGCLHVAHMLAGGHSGRPATFIIGLDDSRFPGAGLQDPLLLDHERREFSAKLSTAADQLADKRRQFARLLARLRGKVVLSYCCHDLADDRDLFPSSALLAAFRILSGKHEADQSDLLEAVRPAVSFAPQSAERCLDEADWWLWRLCGPVPVAEVATLFAEHFPHLQRGQQAADQRASKSFTACDGLVPEAGADLDPTKPDSPVFSASRLEMLGRCPLAWFFRYALWIKPPEDLAVHSNHWLDALAFGSLLHEVFRQFMAELTAQDLLPSLRRDERRLIEIVDQQIATYRDRCPPPNESVFRSQRRQLYATARAFLASEEGLCRRSRPAYMEASLGMKARGEPTPLDDPEPIVINLPDGRQFRAGGHIDRIDVIGDDASHEYAIWDYKTGSIDPKYNDKDPFAGGRVLQHALYLQILETVLKRKFRRTVVVSQAGYYFPARRGQKNRIVKTREELAEAGEVMQRLCQIVANGAFLATNDAEQDCKYCDYRPSRTRLVMRRRFALPTTSKAISPQ